MQTREFKRSVLATWIYLCGELKPGYCVDLTFPEYEKQRVLFSLRENSWVHVKPIKNGVRIVPGEVKTALPALIKKMQRGREHAVSLHNVFSYLYAPNFMLFLVKWHGTLQEDDSVVIDLSWAYQEDIPEYVEWLKVWDVEARVDGTSLICTKKDLTKLYEECVYAKKEDKSYGSTGSNNKKGESGQAPAKPGRPF
jgi:hypothetical protein